MTSTTSSHTSRRTVLAAAAGVLGGSLAVTPASASPATGTPGVAPGTAAGAQPPARVPVRVMTFNIHHGASAGEVFDLGRIARVIEAVDPDVVGLQEADRHWGARSDWADVPAGLGKLLGMRHVYGANLDLEPPAAGEPRRQYGTAVLTPWPVLSWSNTLLPKLADHEQRGLLRADIEVRGARVRFANTHLQHDNSPERQLQAARIRELLGDETRRTVLTGDLNATAEAAELAILTGFLRDTWPLGGDGDGFTYDATAPHARIDFVLASGDIRVHNAAVVDLDPGASDHLPVVSELLVAPGVA